MTNEEKIKIFQEIYEDEKTLDIIFEPDHIEKTYKVDYVEYGVFKAHIECQRLSSDAKKNTATTEPPLKKPHFFQKDNNIVGGENQAGESLSEKKLSPANDGITPATAPSTPHITPVNACKDDKLNVSDINALIERGNDVSDDELKALKSFIDSVIELLPPPAFSAESEKKVSAILYNVLTHTSFSGFFNGFGIQTFNDLCDTIGIKPNVVLDEHNSDKARQVFSWKINISDYLKILAYTADNFKPRVKNHNDTSTPNFDGSLAYGKEILTPSNEDIQAELAEISHMKIDAKKSLMDTINRLDLRGILASDRRGAGFICPLCGNGSGDSGTGVSPYINANGKLKYHCFKCGFNGSVTDLIASANNLDWNAPRVLAIGKRLLKLAESNIHYQYDLPPIEKKSLEQIPEELDTIAADIAAAQSHLAELPFEDRRGLTLETLQHFGVGYLDNWTHPKSRIGNGYYQPPTRRLIIPTSSSHYLAAMPKRDRDKSSENPKMHAGRKEIFNYADIVPHQTILVLEGEIDAMSIWQSTGGSARVIAIGGAVEKTLDKFLAAKKLSNVEKLEYAFSVLLDNDSTGRTNAEKLVYRLTCAGFPATARFLSDEETKTDANDFLTREGDSALAERINAIISDGEIELEQIREDIEKRPKEEVKPATAQIDSAEPPPMQDIPLDSEAVGSDDKVLNLPLELDMPYNFRIDKKGIWRRSKSPKKGGYSPKFNKLLTSMPLIVSRVFVDVESDQHSYEISRYDVNKDKWIGGIIAPAAEIATAVGTSKLAGYGLPIPQSQARDISDFLIELTGLPSNRNKIPVKYIYSTPGWIDEKCTQFLYPNDNDSSYILRDAGNDYSLKFTKRGSYESWQECICKLFRQESPAFALSFGLVLAAPLIKVLELRNLQMLFWGKTGAGKSAIVKAAMSVYGAPSRLKTTFDGTLKAVDALSIAYNDLPLWVDEFQAADRYFRESSDKFIYTYAEQKTRARCQRNGDLRPTKKFCGTRILTGEQPILTESSNAGAYNRLLQINASVVFDKGIVPADIHTFFDANHGHFGKIWIDYIVSHKAEIEDCYKSELKFFREMTDREQWLDGWANFFAASLTALKFAMPLIGDFTAQDVKNSYMLTVELSKDDIPRKNAAYNWQRALQALQDFIFAHPRDFLIEMPSPNPPASRLGYKDGIFPGNVVHGVILRDTTVAIYPNELRTIIEKELNFPSAKAIIREFVDNNVLDLPERNNPKRPYQKSKKLPSVGAKWVYLFRRGTLIDKSYFGDTDE